MVDVTDPTRGNVKDGLSNEEDISYSSVPSSIAVTWINFYDHESGIENVVVTFIKRGIFEIEFIKVFKLHLFIR